MLQNLHTQTVPSDQSGIDLIKLLPNGKVSARNLYKFLELNPSQISRWLKSKIVDNDFAIENEDYSRVDIVVEGQKLKDYYLTPIFAKKLCMQSQSVRGEEARNYFIAMEQIALKNNQKQIIPSYQVEDSIERARAWIVEQEVIRSVQQDNLRLQAENVLMSSRDLVVTTEKDYKWKTQILQADRGRTINYYVSKLFFKGDYREAHNSAKEAYRKDTGISLPSNIKYASTEQKKDYLDWLSQYDGLIINETNIYI
jgi:phage anti-repressor protein